MTSWFKKRGSVPQLDQFNTFPNNQQQQQQVPNPSAPPHINNSNNNTNTNHRQRARSDFTGSGIANSTSNNLSQYHYLITTLISSESFHIFSSSNIHDIKKEILRTVAYQSAFGPEIENLHWDLYYHDIQLTTNSQLYTFINQQLTPNNQTIHLKIKLIRDEKYNNYLDKRAENIPQPPQIGKITYGDFSCCVHIDCGWKEPIINAYNIQYQFILMSSLSNSDTDTAPIFTWDKNTEINIRDIWPWLAYKCRVRLIHHIFDIKSLWSDWVENITVSPKPLDINMNDNDVDEKKQAYNSGYNVVSFFEAMDHNQLTQWTQFKLFGDVSNPLLIYDDGKEAHITKTLNAKMWSTNAEKQSGLLSLVQFAISESMLTGKEFLLYDVDQFINQLLPQELMSYTDDVVDAQQTKPKLSYYASNPVVLNAQNQRYLDKKKSIKDGGYGREDYLSIVYRLRELAFVEGDNSRYSMGIPCYNPYCIFVWMYFLKIPNNAYALYCRDTQSYVWLEYFCAERHNECHLFLAKYYVRKAAEEMNVAFELHEMIGMDFVDDSIKLTRSKPVLLSGAKHKEIIMIRTMHKQHVITRCYNQQKKNEEIITKYKAIEDWHNAFVSRFKLHGANVPYFECILNGIFDKIGHEIALCPAIDVMLCIYFWHSKHDKNKQKVINLTKEKLKREATKWLKPDILKRKEIVQFLFYIWWIISDGTPVLFNSSSITMHKIQQILFGKFGSLDRVFPLLRTIFYGKSQQYMDKIEKSLIKSHTSLNIRMQLLLWYNFMNSVINKQQKHSNNIKINNNIKEMEFTPDLIQMIQIDVELEQQTTIKRAYPLEADAFYALRVNANRNDIECSILPSKYMEKLLSLLLIFKPNYHFIIKEYRMDILQILKKEMNPIQCLEIMYKVLNIEGVQNEQAFIALMEPFVPRISVNAPLFLQTQFQKLLKQYNSGNVIQLNVEDNNCSNVEYEVVAIKHRFSVLNKENKELQQELSEYKHILQSVQNEEQGNNKMKAEINEILNENEELKTMLKDNQFDLEENRKNYMNTIQLLTQQNMQTQTQLNLEKISYNKSETNLDDKNNEIERLKKEICQLKELQNNKSESNEKHKRFRPFLCNPSDDAIEEKEYKHDSEAFKIELLNYMKFSTKHTTSKKYLSLIYFHQIKAQILLNWKSIKTQFFDNLIEKLMDFVDENEIDSAEKNVYNFCYKLIMECYSFMNKENHKYNPMVFNVIYLNLPIFYGLKIHNKISEMLENIYSFLEFMITSISHRIYEDYGFLKGIGKEIKQCIDIFIMECCSTIWSLIHYQYEIGPLVVDTTKHEIFNDDIHKKENQGNGNIECLVFPSVCHMDKSNRVILHDTHIWVLCHEYN